MFYSVLSAHVKRLINPTRWQKHPECIQLIDLYICRGFVYRYHPVYTLKQIRFQCNINLMLYLNTLWADRSSWLCGCDAAVLLLTSVLLVLIGPGGETDGESFSSHQRQTHRDLLKVKTDVFMLPVCAQCFTRIDRQHSHSHPQGQRVSDRPEVRYNAAWETLWASCLLAVHSLSVFAAGPVTSTDHTRVYVLKQVYTFKIVRWVTT